MRKFLAPLMLAAVALLPLSASATSNLTVHNQTKEWLFATAYSATTLRPLSEICVGPGQSTTWRSGNSAYMDFTVHSDHFSNCRGTKIWSKYAHAREIGGGNQDGTFTLSGSPGNFALHGP